MLVGFGDILGSGSTLQRQDSVDTSETGQCHGWELQALESDDHGSNLGFANLLMRQA